MPSWLSQKGFDCDVGLHVAWQAEIRGSGRERPMYGIAGMCDLQERSAALAALRKMMGWADVPLDVKVASCAQFAGFLDPERISPRGICASRRRAAVRSRWPRTRSGRRLPAASDDLCRLGIRRDLADSGSRRYPEHRTVGGMYGHPGTGGCVLWPK